MRHSRARCHDARWEREKLVRKFSLNVVRRAERVLQSLALVQTLPAVQSGFGVLDGIGVVVVVANLASVR